MFKFKQFKFGNSVLAFSSMPNRDFDFGFEFRLVGPGTYKDSGGGNFSFDIRVPYIGVFAIKGFID
jgi:hypothetical protein